MSNDLATQSLGGFPSLLARRAEIEARIPMITPPPRVPVPPGALPTRIDDGPNTAVLAKKRARAEDEARAGLLMLVPDSYTVRTDEGSEEANPSDDVRLDFAKALLPKIESADPATAERLTNAAQAMLGPIVRVDDDANLKNRVLEQKVGGDDDEKPRKAQDDDTKVKDQEDKKEASIADVMIALKGLHERMDTIEGKGRKDEDEGDDDTGDQPGEGGPRDLAADDAKYRSGSLKRRMKVERMDEEVHSWRNEDRFYAFQARADAVAQLFGGHAAKPMAGETLGSYKRRVAREWQSLSPIYRDVDLKVLQKADGIAFNAAIADILVRADSEGRRPTRVPLGTLIERTESKNGHQFTKFYGSPLSWMAPFMATGKRVKRIIERSDSGPGRTLYERA